MLGARHSSGASSCRGSRKTAPLEWRAPSEEPPARRCLLLRSALGEGAQPEAERIELDEACGVLLVVGALVLLEGDVLHRVERLGRLAADHGGVALVEF